jgi:TPR repeat protein
MLPSLGDWEELELPDEEDEIEVDVPQHEPIGRVKSWQLDGSETYETYSQEDVEHLLRLANEYKAGRPLHGVVLNDIGTIHQEGIGMPVNGEAAIYWFKEAYKNGDKLYAPTNLGDLYRKGCGVVESDLKQAFEAYQLSTDPYAHYRIGQAYEEGWICEPDLKNAMKWYKQAAKEGHHLAIKRLKK